MKTTFTDLGVSTSFNKSLEALAIENPTSIQEKVIPFILSQKEDVVAVSNTGSGKTLAFGLPLLQLIASEKTVIQALILVPTRELGQQIYQNLLSYGVHNPDISIMGAFGGIPIKPQIERLKSSTHLVVATPGRLIDLIKRNAIDITHVSYLILDEADEMVQTFKESLDPIISEIPKSRRTLLFTATLSGAVKQLIQNYMSKNVVPIEGAIEKTTQEDIDHQYIVVKPIEKLDVLLHFLNSREGERGIIFCKTKAAVNKLAKNLAIHKFSSGALHGSLAQPIRDRIMGQFRDEHIRILVATDLVARGIDVKELAYVVNYHLPDTFDMYVHRSGRTARAGAKGLSLTILQQEEVSEIAEFEDELHIKFHEFKKASPSDILENNTLLWAKKIFKTKPNRTISKDLKTQIATVFHHLTKEELIDKLVANHLEQTTKVSASKN